MKIYHGTSARFDEFDIKKSKNKAFGRGIYFSAKKEEAEYYANISVTRKDVETSAGPRIIEREVNQAAFLNLRSEELTEGALRAAAKRLKTKLSHERESYIANADETKKFINFKEKLGLNAPEKLAKICGKIGFVYSNFNQNGGDIFVVTDQKYLSDKKYAEKVNHHGATPEFVKKMNKKLGKIQHLDKIANDLAAKSNIFTKRDVLRKSYIKAVIRLSEKLPINVNRMKKSLKKIDEGNDAGWNPERSVRQGVRFALIDEAREKTHGKLCRILGTTADEPDLEHSLLEGEIMSCEEVLEHLSRFGCQHNYEIVE